MAGQTRGRREKREQEMGLCNWIVALFQVLIAFQSMTFISGQGYLHSDTEFQSRKILQDVSLFPKQQPHGVTSEPHDKKLNQNTHTTSQIRIIQFEPPFLDFDAECVGMPKLRTVYIHNPSQERELQLTSISARTSHFHASFFDKKIVPLGGNTSFEVVFLARVVGNVENTLFINTLHGTFPYQVFGIGIPNPYRLRPYLGAKVPVNSSFSPLISMHNPTSEPLQVTEMYSSSGFLQLQLPQGQSGADEEQWEIPPYETKEVIRARFMGHVEANHTAFIRIKTAQAENLNPDFHILPVEVEVSSAPGIYSALELLDFGTLRTRYDEPKTLPLFLLNSGDNEVEINSITVSSPNPAVEIQFKPVKLKPSETIFVHVANVTFTALSAESGAHQKGTITVKTKEKSYSKLEIPFIANLLYGTLGYDQDAVLFHFDERKIVREISLTNLFHFPVVLQNLSLPSDASEIFKVLDFSGPITLPVSSHLRPFSIQYDPGVKTKKSDNGDGSVYYLTLHTNASKFSLPLHTYSGIISYKVLREDKRKLDFGIMGTLDTRQILFALYNHNPAKILLDKINSTLKNIQIRLVSLTQDSGKNLTEETDFQPENFLLPSNSCSVFEVMLSASEKEEDIIGSIKIVTKYQEIVIPVLARIVIGTLTVKPEKIKFPKSFPGLVVHQTLTVVNTFAQATKLECVHSKQIDKRFYYKRLKNQGLSLEPNKKAKIGKVYFDARQSCKPDRCYTGLPTSTTVGHHWLTTLALGPDSVEFDTNRYEKQRHRWKNLQNKGLTGPNTTLVLSADVAMDMEVPVQATLYWPSLLEEKTFEFPLTHVGRKSVASLTLFNPADSPVVVQVLPLSLYPQPEAALKVLGWSDKVADDSFVLNNSTVFHLLDPRDDLSKDSMTSQMVWLEYTLNGKLNHTVVNLFLDPGDRVSLDIEFVPYDDNPKSTVILLRNNLTILDALPLHGRGAYEHLTLGGKTPNLQTSVLRFKLTKDLLKDCTRKKPNPSFTVRKWFHANNTGMLPIRITSMTVSGSPCEGYGFRVLDCDQFILQPNTSKKIEIAYTPDFTSYLVLHKLKLVTAQGNEMHFTLNVTLPPYMLPLCQEAVPRPTWELTLYYFIVSVMIVLLVGVLLMSYLEAINIWELFARIYEAELQHKLGKRNFQTAAMPDRLGKRFDLKNIATNFVTGSSAVKLEPLQNGESAFSGKKMTSATLTPTFKLGPRGELDEIKQNSSQQTDPHSDFPPLSASKFSYYSKGLISRFFNFFTKKEQPKKLLQTENPLDDHDNDIICGKIACLNATSGPRLRHSATNASGEKPKNDKKFRALENFSTNTSYSKPTAEIRPLTKSYEIPKRKNSRCTTPDQISPERNGNIVLKSNAKSKDDFPEQRSESEESITHDVAKKNALERRRTRSKSNQHSRESTSSSGSMDFQEPEIKLKQTTVLDDKPPILGKAPLKTEDPKPLRGKKLRKLQRKQAKANAREKEILEKENLLKEEPGKPSATPSDEEEKPVVENRKISAKKLSRQQKRRSVSPTNVSPTTKKENKFPEKLTRKTVTNNEEKMVNRNSPPLRNANDQNKPAPKRRSYSYNSDVSKQKEKPGKITIYKRPNPNDSRSSSSQEISESSSGESTALWDTPSQQRDIDEDMRQIAKQSQQAELMIGDQKRGKDRKRGKGTVSPVHLSSGSRSSSYSSVMSCASSNDGNTTKPQNNGPPTGTPSKKLSRSMSDATGGSTHPSKAQFRKRSPYPRVAGESPTVSPTHSARKDLAGARTTSPQNPPNNHPARTLSSPSMFTNSFGYQQKQGFGPGAQDASNPQWSYQNHINASSYSAFGKSPFNLMENLKSKASSTQNTATPSWGSPFSDNSSLYSTPSPPRPRNPSPPSSLSMRPRHWSISGSPVQNTGYPTFDTPPVNPTSQPLTPQGLGWGEIPSPTSVPNMTTHSIWSVSNAVTMDENRNTEECDPLGVRSIWSNARQYQNWERNLRR